LFCKNCAAQLVDEATPEVATASLLAADPVRGLSLSSIRIADVHCDDRKLFMMRADEKLTALMELESAIRLVGIVLTGSCLCPNSTPSGTGVRAGSFSPGASFSFFRCALPRVNPLETN